MWKPRYLWNLMEMCISGLILNHETKSFWYHQLVITLISRHCFKHQGKEETYFLNENTRMKSTVSTVTDLFLWNCGCRNKCKENGLALVVLIFCNHFIIDALDCCKISRIYFIKDVPMSSQEMGLQKNMDYFKAWLLLVFVTWVVTRWMNFTSDPHREEGKETSSYSVI